MSGIQLVAVMADSSGGLEGDLSKIAALKGGSTVSPRPGERPFLLTVPLLVCWRQKKSGISRLSIMLIYIEYRLWV
jgi:hypothetical protein